MKKFKWALALTGIIIASSSMVLLSKEEAPEAIEFNINNYSWLAGHWTGDGFGGISDEVWSLPADGVMMGVYRNIQDGKVSFYEFITLDDTGMKLKHFTPEMKSWEEKEDFVHFELVEATANKLTFKGLVMELKSETEMDISLRMREKDEVRTEVFHMKRVKP
ncbi:MAG: hypothetical protein HEP71_09390 [Roseivirga sp.]|nr:hypothetical protein [Roseivirga sp.]